MRILSIDYGERRTGLAITDELGITAQGLDTIIASSEEDVFRKVVEIVRKYEAGKILLGLPLNMNGSESEKSEKVRAFGKALEVETSLPVVYWDERMTSMQAKRVMAEMEVKSYGKKHLLDRISATLMLQEYMKTF
ncbi:MAG: Holliday junction resolvase RuvX [Candidatus Latescibacterota bacterium]